MTAFDKMFGEDRVHDTILRHLPGSQRTGKTTRFNCPMCVLRGEKRADQRRRGGVGYTAEGDLGVSCFNCGFSTRFTRGRPLNQNMKEFLAALGVPRLQIGYLAHWAALLHDMVSDADPPPPATSLPTWPDFAPRTLPLGARPIEAWAREGCDDPDFLAASAYLSSRGPAIAQATTYYWTPTRSGNLNHRIIIPCHHEDMIVGWIARAVRAQISPKYHNDTPPNFLFNLHALTRPDRRIVVVVEGIFDALAIDAVGLLGARANPVQTNWIGRAGKRVICLPDRDKAGARLIDLSLQERWEVSFPRPLGAFAKHAWWDRDIKDAADATTRYGRLYALRSIIESSTADRIRIDLHKRAFCPD